VLQELHNKTFPSEVRITTLAQNY